MNNTRLGALLLSAGVLTFANLPGWAATIIWTNTSGGNWSVAANWNPNQVPGSSDMALITVSGAYTVTLDVNATIAGMTLGGTGGTQTFSVGGNTLTLNGLATINGNGLFKWSGGTLAGTNTFVGTVNWSAGSIGSSASVTIASNAVLNISGSSTLYLYGVLTNAGTVNWTGTGDIQVHNYSPAGYTGGIVNLAGAVFNAQNDQAINNAFGNEYFNNAGLFVKSPTTGTNTITVTFNNSGTVEVNSGLVVFNGGGAGSGTFNAAAGAGITFGSSYSASAFNGAGTYTVAIPVELSRLLERQGLPRVRPAEKWYNLLLDRFCDARSRMPKRSPGDWTYADLNWFSSEIQGRVAAIFELGYRIPQELVGTDCLMRRMHNL